MFSEVMTDSLNASVGPVSNWRTTDQDDVAIATLMDIEGGDGIIQFAIIDDTIQSLDAGHLRASADLRDYANALVTGRFVTDQYGYASGQVLSIQLPLCPPL